MKTKYPLTLAAAKKGENSLWEIGDALLKECPMDDFGKLTEVVKELQAHGCEHSVGWLSSVRATAEAFPNPTRVGFSFSIHKVAGSPEMLKTIVKGAPKGTVITQGYVQSILQRVRDHAQQEVDEKRSEAQAEIDAAVAEEKVAEEKEKKARDEETKAAAKAEKISAKAKTKAAREKKKAAKLPPKRNLDPPEPEAIPVMLAEATWMDNAAKAAFLARESVKAIQACLHELTPKGINALTSEGLEVVNAWNDAVRIVRQEMVNSSGHISVVGE